MGYPGKERQQQLRAAKGAKGNNVIREERRAARAGICEPNTISKLQTLAQDSSSSAAVVTAPNASPSTLDASVAVVSFATPSTNQAPPADNASRSHATSQQPFAARIAAVAARRTGGRHHRRSRVPSQKERLSRRIVFRDLTGVPLAALGLSHNLGGSVAADIVGNWPSEVLGEELLGSDDEEEEDMKDDDEGIEDMEDDDDEEMPDVRYDSDIYDSDGNEWAALGVNMKEGRP